MTTGTSSQARMPRATVMTSWPSPRSGPVAASMSAPALDPAPGQANEATDGEMRLGVHNGVLTQAREPGLDTGRDLAETHIKEKYAGLAGLVSGNGNSPRAERRRGHGAGAIDTHQGDIFVVGIGREADLDVAVADGEGAVERGGAVAAHQVGLPEDAAPLWFSSRSAESSPLPEWRPCSNTQAHAEAHNVPDGDADVVVDAKAEDGGEGPGSSPARGSERPSPDAAALLGSSPRGAGHAGRFDTGSGRGHVTS